MIQLVLQYSLGAIPVESFAAPAIVKLYPSQGGTQ